MRVPSSDRKKVPRYLYNNLANNSGIIAEWSRASVFRFSDFLDRGQGPEFESLQGWRTKLEKGLQHVIINNHEDISYTCL